MYNEKTGKSVDILCTVFEMTAFMFGEPVEKEELAEQNPPEAPLKAEIAFSGKLNGSLTMMVTEDMCVEIASSMLGLEEDDPAAIEKSQDALKEVLNMTCGNLTTELAGDTEVENLTIPMIYQTTADEWTALLDHSNTGTLLVEDFPVLLCLKLEEV